MPKLASHRMKIIADQVVARLQPSRYWRFLEVTALIAGISALGFSGYATWQSNEGLKIANDQAELANRAFYEQRVASAWQILAQPDSDSGKQFALQTLIDADVEIDGLEIACKNGIWKYVPGVEQPYYDCPNQRILRGLKIARKANDNAETPDLRSAKIINSRFKGTNLTNALITDVPIADSSFDGANLAGARFYNSNISGSSFRGARFSNTVIAGDDKLLELVKAVHRLEENQHSQGELGRMVNSSFHFSDLDGLVFDDIELTNIDFSYSNLVGLRLIGSVSVDRANVSGAHLCEQEDTPEADWICSEALFEHAEKLWYYETNVPHGLVEFEKQLPMRLRICPVPKPNSITDDESLELFNETSNSLGCGNFSPDMLESIIPSTDFDGIWNFAAGLLNELS